MKAVFLAVLALLLGLTPLARAGEHTVVIDPGHGGTRNAGTQAQRSLSSANNATTPGGGLKEKNLTLELSLEIAAQVRALAPQHPGTRLECRLTRTTDVNPDFIARAAFCAAVKPVPSAIISVHFNASTGHDALGSLAVIHHPGVNRNHPADREFAVGLTRAVNAAVARFVPGSRAREPITDAHLHGGAGSNFFYQLATHETLAKVPKCFLEVEFIDRADVDKRLLQQRRESFPAVAKAIAEHLYGQFR